MQRGMEHDDEDDDDGDDADAHGVEVAKYQSYQYIIVGRQASTHLLGHRGVQFGQPANFCKII